MQDMQALNIKKEGETTIIAFKATSISNVEKIAGIAQRIKDFIKENHPNRIVFDFTDVKFFSSQVLGLLLDVRSTLEKYGGTVGISGINPELHRVFRITHLDKVFKFFRDQDEAIRELEVS